METEKTCARPTCGKTFWTRKSNKKFCCQLCSTNMQHLRRYHRNMERFRDEIARLRGQPS